jgi:hypothetical protein
MADRRFPPPWTIEEANDACFIVCDSTGQALGAAKGQRRTQRNALRELV